MIEQLDGDFAMQPRIPCPEDVAHPAATQAGLNLIWSESPPGFRIHAVCSPFAH
jgi:hypothetical protein